MSSQRKKFARAAVPTAGKGKKKSVLARLSKVTLGDVGSIIGESAGMIRRMMNVEVKRFDQNNGAVAPGAAGVIYPQSLLAQGDDYNQRDGLSVRTLAFESRLSFNVAAGGFQEQLRFIVFSDTQCQGVAPTIAQLLEVAHPLSQFNHLNTERFAVLHDELVDVTTTGPAITHRVIKMPLDLHLRYSAAAGAIGSCRENNLFVALICLTANGTVDIYSRTSFVDN